MTTLAVAAGIDVRTDDGCAELEMHVHVRLGGRVRDFRLVVGDRGLILRGHAQTYHAKQLAQHAVMEATDVPIWSNDIEVSRAGPYTYREEETDGPVHPR
jgi:hypothetical protein